MVYIFLICFILILFIPSKKVKFGFFRLRRNLIPLSIILLTILLVIFSEDVFHSAHNGLLLWANNVVPSLLPFLICLEILKRTNIIKVIGKILEPIFRPIFNIPGSGVFAIVMGMCSGYPVGAKFAASLREEKQCSTTEGERLLAFTNTSGPLFIVGAVGIGMFADSKVGFLLLITHFVSAILVGVVFRFYKLKNTSLQDKTSLEYKKNKSSNSIKLAQLGGIMGDAIRNSIATLLLICGFITFFCVLGTILDKTGLSNLLANMFYPLFTWMGIPEKFIKNLSIGSLKGILEITSGLKIISNTTLSYNLLLPIVATILGFGGISVHMQVASIISNTDLSMKPYLLGKTLHGVFAGLLTYFVLNHTNILDLEALETFSRITSNDFTSVTGNISGSGNIFILSISALTLITLLALLLKRKKSI